MTVFPSGPSKLCCPLL